MTVPSTLSPLIGAVQDQDESLTTPLSDSHRYFVFISKSDEVQPAPPAYDVLFEVVPAEWMIGMVLSLGNAANTLAPDPPATLFVVSGVQESTIVDALGLNTSDELAEGSWYLATLLEGTDGPIVGDLYAEDADLNGPPSPIGTYSLSDALQLSLPAVTAGGFVVSGPPTNPLKVPQYGPIDLITQLNARFRPWGEPFAIPPPTDELSPNPQPPPPFTSVGVMDIGAGGCNLLIKGNEPWGYYDAGFPIFTYYRSAPAGLQRGPNYQGPIEQNTTLTLRVILSHWDWDHWRLGRVALPLSQVQWIVPDQNLGGAAIRFRRLMPRRVRFLAQEMRLEGLRLLRCQWPNAPLGAVMNNTGLAVFMFLDDGVAPQEAVIMTGDADFPSLPPPYPNPPWPLGGIVAVHHGSDNFGAADHLPAPAGNQNGWLAYSYGIYPQGPNAVLTHCYGFPVPAAVQKYDAAMWTVSNSTAEGPNINAVPPAIGSRGNIRMGDQTDLDDVYQDTAFYDFPNELDRV